MPDYIRDATEHMSLGDIKARDIDNLGLVVKESKEHLFDRKEHAGRFMGQAVNGALKKLGVDQLGMISKYSNRHDKRFLAKQIDKAMAENNVKVERRKYQEPEDIWRSGIYIYHNNEIAYFISECMRVKEKTRDSHIIILGAPKTKFMVITNFRDLSS